ncbi:uncharacterized protein LOC108116725 [Drosophila eugracilis]|uniref:uncharacterized protein LOC108116725 n=1 Tax=Drosophila eugracilis TaxID=29029 RepID=UPI0007E66E1C|nr:uncharacterized protein LOC108116725 [Drosophila eugracilis]
MTVIFKPHYTLSIGMEMLKVFVTASLLFFYQLETTNSTGKCKFSRNHFENFTLEIKNNTLFMDMITSKTIHRGLKVLIDTQITLDKGRSYQRLFAHILDTCSVISPVRGNLFKSWFDSMLKHGNFMVNCPVPAGNYFLRDWKLDSQLVPHYLLPGDYCISAHFFYGKLKSKQEDFFLDIEVYALLKADS